MAGGVATLTACGSAFSSGESGTDSGTGDVSTLDSGAGDSSPGEGSVADTGASDAPVEAGPSWCSTQPSTLALCEDFDSYPTVQQFLSSWTTYSAINGTFSFDNTAVPSPPNALAAATTNTSGVRTLALHVLPAPPQGPIKKLRLEFDLLISQATGIDLTAASGLAAIVFGSDVVSGGAVALGIVAGPQLAAIYVGPQPADGGVPLFGASPASSPFPALSQWDGRYAIEIDYTAPEAGVTTASACAQLFIGTVAQGPCLSLPAELSSRPVTTIALGVYSGGLGKSGTIGAAFDNVTFSVD